MFKVYDVGMVDVTNAVDGDPPLQLTVKAASIMTKLMVKPLAKMLMKV